MTVTKWLPGLLGVAGILMWGDPAAHVDETYREEFAPGVAEDMARVVSLDARARVPYGTFNGCLKTENFTPLEPDLREEKYYCPEVGLVLEVSLGVGCWSLEVLFRDLDAPRLADHRHLDLTRVLKVILDF